MLNPFLCPLSMEVFEHPVIASDGFTYERCAIEMWIDMNTRPCISPLTNDVIRLDDLLPNCIVMELLEYVAANGVDVCGADKLTQHCAQHIIQYIYTKSAYINQDSESHGMDEPVVYRDGLTYEKNDIEEWTLFPEDLVSNKWLLALMADIDALNETSISSTLDAANTNIFIPSAPSSTEMMNCPDSVMEDLLTCPISLEVMKDPVLARDGFTYERYQIEEWIRRNGVSPMTSMPLSIDELVPNILVRQIISATYDTPLVVEDKVPTHYNPESMASDASSSISDIPVDLDHVSTEGTKKGKVRRMKKISKAMKKFLVGSRKH